MSWYKGLKGKILFDEPLSAHTSFKIPAKAGIWIEPFDLEDLRRFIKVARARDLDYVVIGEGSNLLFRRRRIPLVVHLGSPNFKRMSVEGNYLTAGAAAALGRIIQKAKQHGLGGLEFLSGIPGALGGALVMNAGTGWPRRREIGDFIDSIEVIDKNANVRLLHKAACGFGYRSSSLSSDCIITSATLKLKRKSNRAIQKEISGFLNYRCKRQDLKNPSAGCIFKNPQGVSAGRLIDRCGLKGRKIGGAAISRKHANFIINRGRASGDDVFSLMELIKKEVYKKFRFNLEPEVRVIE